MYIAFFNHNHKVFDSIQDVKTYVNYIIDTTKTTPYYMSIRIDYEDTVFWDIDGNNIPTENITKFHPELTDKINMFINAANENPRVMPIQSNLNIAALNALDSRYKMFGYAILDMMQMIYPNHIIVLEPL